MTILKVTLQPKLGSNQQMQELLTSWVDWRGGQGDTVALSRSIWGANGQVFNAVSRHASIGEADEFRQMVVGEDRYQTLISELSGLMAAPPSWELLDVVVPVNRTDGSKPISTRVSIHPDLGHVQDVSGLLADWVTDAQSRGIQTALMQQVWGSNGAKFVVRTAFESVGEADELRRALGESDEYRQFVSNLTPLLSGMPAWELNESVASAGF